uniref:Uncharacterized protein n=1 Tax=Oryza rufipogon TaxID=4529 RepID=A0A0E0NSY6_ORYRU
MEIMKTGLSTETPEVRNPCGPKENGSNLKVRNTFPANRAVHLHGTRITTIHQPPPGLRSIASAITFHITSTAPPPVRPSARQLPTGFSQGKKKHSYSYFRPSAQPRPGRWRICGCVTSIWDLDELGGLFLKWFLGASWFKEV